MDKDSQSNVPKKNRLKFSKLTIAITMIVILVSAAIAMLINSIIENRHNPVNINVPTAETEKPEEKAANKGENEDPSVQKAITKEQEDLSKKGLFIKGIDSSDAKEKEKQKQMENELYQKENESAVSKDNDAKEKEQAKQSKTKKKKDKELDSESLEMLTGSKEPHLQQQTVTVNAAESRKQALWGMIFGKETSSAKTSSGGIMTAMPKDKDGAAASAKNASASSSESALQRLPSEVRYYKPYKARIEYTISTDSKAASSVPFVATITEPGPLKDWRVLGNASPDLYSQRFLVTINAVLDKEDRKYKASGYAGSIDESNGVITAVRHDEIRSIATMGLLSAAGKALEALGNRGKETTTTITPFGTTTTENNANVTTKQALMEGVGEGFNEMRKQVEKSPMIQLEPTLILKKRTPILIYFTK